VTELFEMVLLISLGHMLLMGYSISEIRNVITDYCSTGMYITVKICSLKKGSSIFTMVGLQLFDKMTAGMQDTKH
jgi:hypothetical protein